MILWWNRFFGNVVVEEVLLLSIYFWLAGRSFYQGLWWRATYWVGAFILSLAVIKGLNR